MGQTDLGIAPVMAESRANLAIACHAGSDAEGTLLAESSRRRQGASFDPCRREEISHFSKSSNAELSVQTNSMMSQPGLS